MGQRLVRTPKNWIRQAGIPFRLPERADAERAPGIRAGRHLCGLLGGAGRIRLGTEFRRRNLAEEGIWLGRLFWPRS